jgi:hypothetical protein
MAASIEITSVQITGSSTATLKYKWSELSSNAAVYIIRCYAILDGDEIDCGKTEEFAGPSGNSTFYIDNLIPNTSYKFRIKLYNTSDNYLTVSHTTVNKYVTEKSEEPNWYYAELWLYPNGGNISSSYWRIPTDQNGEPAWSTSDRDYVNITIRCTDYLNGESMIRPGYTLLGFSEDRNATVATYDKDENVTVKATSTDYSDPTVLKLYAIWEKISLDPWAWPSSIRPGNTLSITASKWNDFVDYIVEYAELNDIPLLEELIEGSYAARNEKMKASQANNVISLLEAIRADPPAYVTQNVTPITAQFFYDLRDAFNDLL